MNSSKPEVVIVHESQPGNASAQVSDLRHDLKERYGVYNVLEVDSAASDATHGLDVVPSVRINASSINFGEGEPVICGGEAYSRQLSSFALRLSFDSSALSIRTDHTELDAFMTPDGSLGVLRDPRTWIMGNSFMQTLVGADSRYGNLVDFIRDERGLFIKPSRFKNQRNYWNAPTNGGLPVVKKRDEIHEGTFMAHDLEHFAIQDPVPFSFSDNPEYLRIYLRHRMASEATTLALTDMIAVDVAGLKEQGYDITKRRIFPLYESVLPAFEGATISELTQRLMEANIAYALTGDIRPYTELGADSEALSDYAGKYEVFFSADYDWNKENYLRVQREVAANPLLVDYFKDIHEEYGIPVVESIYPETGKVDDVMNNFTVQVNRAFDYTPRSDSEIRGNRLAAVKYLAGQQIIFYRFHDVEGAASSLASFKELVMALQGSTDVATQTACLDAANSIYQHFVGACVGRGRIYPQEERLYQMHAPLYPPLFINYAKEGGDYRNLNQKMKADGVYN